MLKSLFLFSGSATRKEWWYVALPTAAASGIFSLCGGATSPLGLLCAPALLPWLAVSVRRMRDTGNTPEHCLFSFGGVAGLLLLIPHLQEDKLAIAAPFLSLLLTVSGIVALSHALICGFVSSSRED